MNTVTTPRTETQDERFCERVGKRAFIYARAKKYTKIEVSA